MNSNGSVVCAPTNSNAYAVGSVFNDLDRNRQQNIGEPGTTFNRNDSLTVYAINADNRVIGRSSVGRTGYWRIDSGITANTSYTFVLTEMPGIQIGIQSPPSLQPPGALRTGENQSTGFQSPGVADAVVDSKIIGNAILGSVNMPSHYLNFGLTDRLFASGFD